MTSWGTAAVLFTGGVCEREPRHGHVRPQFSFRSCLIRILIHIFAAADANFSPAAEQPARAHTHAQRHTHTLAAACTKERCGAPFIKKKISPPSSRTSHLNAPTHPSSPSSILQSSSVLLSHAHTHAHTPSMTGNVQGRSPPSPPPPPPTPASKAPQLRGGGGGGSHIPAVTGSSCAPEPSTQHSRAFFLFVLFFVFTPLPSLQH